MKGNVSMNIDRANIIQAVEDWLGKELATRPKVTAVDQETYDKDQFIVVFTHDTPDVGSGPE